MLPTTLTATDRQFRGLTYLAHGQSCETWLPAGKYRVLGPCTVSTRHGAGDAVKLERTVKGINVPGASLDYTLTETWYVGPIVFSPETGKV